MGSVVFDKFKSITLSLIDKGRSWILSDTCHQVSYAPWASSVAPPPKQLQNSL